MSNIAIIRHISNEGPGYLGQFLDVRKLPYQLIRVDTGESIPDSLAGFSAIVLMGGLMSVNDSLPWIADEITLIRKALDADMPVLGHCLGGQMIAKALGAQVSNNRVREFGWHRIQCRRRSDTDHWLADLPDEFDAFHWHGETFALPRGAHHLFSNQWCENQGFSYGKSLALQCHIEMTEPMIRDWVAHAPAAELDGGPSTPFAETILRQTPGRLAAMQQNADILYERWLEGLTR